MGLVKVFVNCSISRAALLERLATATGSSTELFTVVGDGFEIDVCDNDRRLSEPGFVNYPYYIDVVPNGCDQEWLLSSIKNVLEEVGCDFSDPIGFD
jgi:hypothetical protein